MRIESAVIRDEVGLHARPASQFVKLAGTFQSAVTVRKEGDTAGVNGKSITSLLLMGAVKGNTVLIVAEGPDEEQACRALRDLLEQE